MAKEQSASDIKLVQYLTEAYGKEKELETALQAHISMTTKDTYRKRLQDHLKETKQHAKLVERRIKALGGSTSASAPGPVPDAAAGAATTVTSAASKAVALAQGPIHALRGTGEAEKQLKNARTELANEFEEIGQYLAIEELANAVGDKDTAKVAKAIRREEERMANFLQKLIPTLTKAVVREEIPASERNASSSRSRSASRATGSSGRSAASRSAAGSKAATTRKASGTKTAAKRTATSAKTTAKKAASTAKSAAKSTAKSASASSGSAKSNGSSRTTKSSGSRTTKSSGTSRGRATAKK